MPPQEWKLLEERFCLDVSSFFSGFCLGTSTFYVYVFLNKKWMWGRWVLGIFCCFRGAMGCGFEPVGFQKTVCVVLGAWLRTFCPSCNLFETVDKLPSGREEVLRN